MISWAEAILTLPGIYNVTGQHGHVAIIAGAKRKLFTHLKKTKAHSLKTRELETVAYLATSFVFSMMSNLDDYNILYRNQWFCLTNEGWGQSNPARKLIVRVTIYLACT